jgi:pimeloyl-ACP methyl ester carboxylesterase
MKRISANGLSFAALEEGSGPLVLLVHGFPDTAHTWDRVLPALAAHGYRAVAPFTRGYAPTEIPSDGKYDAETLGRDLLALIEALGERSAVIVGHDFGANAAYAAAAIDPGRVRLLVTVALPHPAAMAPTPRLLWLVRHFFVLRRRGAAERIRERSFEYIEELVRRWSPTWQVPPGETSAVRAAFREPGCLEAALGYYRALGPRLSEAQRRRIEVPAVCFSGEQDPVRRRHFERARSRFTGPYEVVSMPGGHFMHREHPERFISELLDVLARHDATRAAS